MLEKLSWGRYNKSTKNDRDEFLKTAMEMVKKYGWENEEVYPYSFPLKITKILDDFADFDRCTEGSKEYLIQLVNGLADILNKWEEKELEEKVEVRIKQTGKVIKISRSSLELLGKFVEVV